MDFTSDNTGPVHPRILDAVVAANAGRSPPYGTEPLMAEVRAALREAFEAPQAAVYLVATGTAANALLLATLARPWQTIYCATHAHIQDDECAAPEFFTGGAKLTLVDGPDGKIDAGELEAIIAGGAIRGVHGVQRGPVSITQATERGTLYTPDEIAGLAAVAGRFGLPVHMDGARFANAVAALGCRPADITWRAGVDALSLGATKNGCMGVEAMILFDPAQAWELELRRKRAAQLFSKHRFLAAQMSAWLRDDLWLELAGAANAAASRLAEGLAAQPGVRLQRRAEANMIFADWPRRQHQRLFDAGARYYLWSDRLEGGDPEERLTARLVCDWSSSEEDARRFLAALEPEAALG